MPRQGTSRTDAWRQILVEFNEATGHNFGLNQLRKRWQNQKRTYQVAVSEPSTSNLSDNSNFYDSENSEGCAQNNKQRPTSNKKNNYENDLLENLLEKHDLAKFKKYEERRQVWMEITKEFNE